MITAILGFVAGSVFGILIGATALGISIAHALKEDLRESHEKDIF